MIRVASAEEPGGETDWVLALQLGPGPLATTPDATIALGMDVLIEIHDRAELDRALGGDARIGDVRSRAARPSRSAGVL